LIFAEVWKLVKRIPRGRVATYGQLSQMIGKRLTPVGIGWAIRAGKDLPWHRVINSRGTVSTDNEHPGLQRAMLEAEGVEFDGDAIDLTRYQWQPRALSVPAKKPKRAGSGRRPSRRS
jgi:methylated-DNA-protein-cysteine methyltransferase related protein